MTLSIKPQHSNILVKKIEKEQSNSGFYIPENSNDKTVVAEVLAVGDEQNVFSNLIVGDKIIFAKISGFEIQIERENYIIVRFENILAKLVDKIDKDN